MRRRAKISLRKKDFGFGCTDRSSFEGTEIGRPLCDIGKIKLLTLPISKYVYTTCIIYSLYNVNIQAFGYNFDRNYEMIQ